MNRFTRSLVTAVALSIATLAPVTAFAADEVNVTRGIGKESIGIGFRSVDLVSIHAGNSNVGLDDHAVVHDRVTYRFASADNATKFKADPTKYLPQYGGFCAYGAAVGKKFDGDPRYYQVVNGKLYVVYNAKFFEEWKKDVAGNVAKADGNWTRIKSVAADKL